MMGFFLLFQLVLAYQKWLSSALIQAYSELTASELRLFYQEPFGGGYSGLFVWAPEVHGTLLPDTP
jgi:hypothetical protein